MERVKAAVAGKTLASGAGSMVQSGMHNWVGKGAGLCLGLGLMFSVCGIEPTRTVRLWPGLAPGDKPTTEVERDLTKPTDNDIAGRRLIRLGHVSEPTLAVYRPPAEIDTGASVLICPGGGYHILAWDLEGTEVCEWLNSIGVTGVLLKYRVPKREGREGHAAPLEDAQRAMGLLRQNAAEWGLDPARIGVLGFSAGGHLAAVLSNRGNERSYPRVDAADDLASRPDFAVLIYPAYLTVASKGDEVSPDLPVTSATPPTLMVITQDDPVRVENVLGYARELQRQKVPMELHLYPKGGHGYGLRRTELPVTHWPDRATDWMKHGGLLKKR